MPAPPASNTSRFYSTGDAEGADPFDTLAVPGAEPPLVDVPEDSPALIMYTSGTTGRPKGAVLRHQNLHAQAMTLIRGWRLFADDEVNLCASPLFHIASIGGVAPIVLIGGTTVLLPSGRFSSAARPSTCSNRAGDAACSSSPRSGRCCAPTRRCRRGTCPR